MRKLSIFAIHSCNNARMNDWDDLRYFLAVARAGNVTAAAAQLRVNHSTVSRRISAMEAKHGVRLFDRVPMGYRLTTAGENIQQLALDIEQKNQKVERLLFAQDTRLQGRVSVTLSHELANVCVLPNFKAFIELHPDIDLNFIVSAGLKNLSAREADIAVRLTDSPPEHLIGQEVAKLRHGVYCAKEYDHTNTETPHVILWHFEEDQPAWVKKHYPNAKVVLRVDDLASMYAAVKAGFGLARMPTYLPDAKKDENVHRLNLSLKPSTWGVWVLVHTDLRHTRRVVECKSFITQCIKNQKGLFEGRCSNFCSE